MSNFPPTSKHIVMVAGEASGDHHGACLVAEIKKSHPDFQFTGIGGTKMAAEGVTLLSDLARYGIVGFSEVLKHFFIIRRAFNTIKQLLKNDKPDVLVLIDYPGFNLRLAKVAHALGIKVIYYISPQIWAWKKGRIKQIKKYVDHMAVILPFEVDVYRQANIPVSYVGHPLVASVKSNLSANAFKTQVNIAHTKRIISLLPGSRGHEVERLLPTMLDSAVLLNKQYSDLHFILPVASTIDIQYIHQVLKAYDLPITIVKDNTYNALACSHSAIVCSGTATLETALMNVPMVIIYKLSAFSAAIVKRILTINMVGLCNLIAEEKIVPELLQEDAIAKKIFQQTTRYLNEPVYYQTVKNKLTQLKQTLAQVKPDQQISQIVINS